MPEPLRLTDSRRELLDGLMRAGGVVHDRGGGATARLVGMLSTERHGSSLRRTIIDLDNGGLIEREISGRRVFRIALTDQGRSFCLEHDIGPPSDRPRVVTDEDVQNREQLVRNMEDVGERLVQWALTVDLEGGPDQVRAQIADVFHSNVTGRLPSPAELTRAVVEHSAVNERLLDAFVADPTRAPDLELDAAIRSLLDLRLLLFAMRSALEQE